MGRKKIYVFGIVKKIIIIFLLLCIKNHGINAQEARTFKPIPTPKNVSKMGRPMAQTIPVPEQKVNRMVKEMFNSWKRGTEFEKYLSEDFYNKDKLVDAMTYKVPVDAKARILSIKNTRVLEQYAKPSTKKDGRIEVNSIVSVTADTQIEFNDVNSGLRKLDGENEYIIRIKGELVPVK